MSGTLGGLNILIDLKSWKESERYTRGFSKSVVRSKNTLINLQTRTQQKIRISMLDGEPPDFSQSVFRWVIGAMMDY